MLKVQLDYWSIARTQKMVGWCDDSHLRIDSPMSTNSARYHLRLVAYSTIGNRRLDWTTDLVSAALRSLSPWNGSADEPSA